MFKVWINDGTTEMPSDDILYIVSKEGIFLKKKLGLFESMAKVDKISILNEIDSYAAMDIKKMPARDFAKVFAFMREVLRVYHSEGTTIIHYHPETRKYRIEVPTQQVSHGGLDYKSELTYDGYVRIGTIHSHADFSAFHSGTDKHDEENWDGIHITIGHVDQYYFTLSANIVANGSRFWADPINYVNGLSLEEVTETKAHAFLQETTTTTTLRYKLDALDYYFKFPAYWLENVSKKTFAEKHWRTAAKQAGLFDETGNTIYNPEKDPFLVIPEGKTYSDMVLEYADASPCEICPYRDDKMDILMEEYFENQDEDDEHKKTGGV
jgi:hypothetical protein